MLTYSLEKDGGESLYTQLYACIRRDILSGTLSPRQKLPSKRALAQHLEVSVITVKNAYEQLAAEGYIYTVEKKGYYVSPLESPLPPAAPPPLVPERPAEPVFLDLATGSLDRSYFPFTVWSRLMRQTILEEDTELLRSTPYNGAPALRRAIAAHLRQFRAMDVDPEQIIIGAGTELLYTLIIQLLGRDKRYAVEDPGYGKIAKIYQAHQVPLCRVGLDGGGLDITLLRRQPADVVHISPSHHYPTGIVMPITRRQELLRWAAEQPERYILEDDYDSEFRFVGRPIPHAVLRQRKSAGHLSEHLFQDHRPVHSHQLYDPAAAAAGPVRKGWAFTPAPCPASSSIPWPGFWSRDGMSSISIA